MKVSACQPVTIARLKTFQYNLWQGMNVDQFKVTIFFSLGRRHASVGTTGTGGTVDVPVKFFLRSRWPAKQAMNVVSICFRILVPSESRSITKLPSWKDKETCNHRGFHSSPAQTKPRMSNVYFVKIVEKSKEIVVMCTVAVRWNNDANFLKLRYTYILKIKEAINLSTRPCCCGPKCH